MSIIKKSNYTKSKITISSTVYVCNECGHTEIVKKISSKKKCPKCNANMTIISSSCDEEK